MTKGQIKKRGRAGGGRERKREKKDRKEKKVFSGI